MWINAADSLQTKKVCILKSNMLRDQHLRNINTGITGKIECVETFTEHTATNRTATSITSC